MLELLSWVSNDHQLPSRVACCGKLGGSKSQGPVGLLADGEAALRAG